MDTRIGFPNEHLAHDSDEELSSPIFATSVGLLMSGIEHIEQKYKGVEIPTPPDDEKKVEIKVPVEVEAKPEEEVTVKLEKKNKGIFERWTDKLKDFLENAE